MTANPTSSCGACGFAHLTPRSESLVRCGRCGTITLAVTPSSEEIRQHYESATTFRTWQGEEPARRALWTKRIEIVRRFATGNRLLDIGTGDGHFLELAAPSFAVQGTEISPRAIEIARSRGLEPMQGTLSEIDFGEAQFDVITLWHVLEHIPSPSFTLDRLHQLLSPDGIVVIAVPNETRRLPGDRLEEETSKSIIAEDEIHLHFWTPRSLKVVLRAHDWDLVWLGVDDVHLVRNRWIVTKYHFNVLLSRLTGWHFDPAMVVVCRNAS